MFNLLNKFITILFFLSLCHFQIEGVEVSGKRLKLSKAIENKNVDKIRLLIESNSVSIDELSSSDRTPLMEAAKASDLAMVNYLIEKGANVNYQKNSDSTTALYETLDSTNFDDATSSLILLALIKAGADINTPSHLRHPPSFKGVNYPPSPFMKACEIHAVNCVNVFLENGVDIESKDRDGKTALMYSLRSGKSKVMKMLINKGASLEAIDSKNKTALFHAIEKKSPTLIDLLIAAGANTHAVDDNGTSIFMYALATGTPDITSLFIKIDHNSKAVNYENESALFFTSKTNDINTAAYLLKEGLEINQKNIYGETPFLKAVKENKTEMALFLFQRGADVVVKTEKGAQAIIHVVKNRNHKLLQLLIENKAPLNTRDYLGLTPLMQAIINQDEDIATLLLTAGASTKAQTTQSISVGLPIGYSTGFGPKSYTIPSGSTPLDIAKLSGNTNMIKLLETKN